MENSKNSFLASIITVLIGVMVCIGWLADIPMLTSIVPDLPPMKFNTALCSIMLGIVTYWLNTNNYPRLQVVFIALILGYCTLSLIQDIADIDIGMDEFFVTDVRGHQQGISRPGRMSQFSAACLIMISLTLLALRQSAFRVMCQVMILISGLISLMAIIGYLLQAPIFYNYYLFASMSMPTALVLFMNSITILTLNPHIGILKFISSFNIGSTIIFKLFPRLVVAVLALSAVELAMHKKGLITDEVESALFTLAFIVIGFLLILYTARELNRVDQKRTEAENALRKSHENLEAIVAERTKTLAEREHLLKSIFDNIDASIIVKGLDGVFTMGNRAFHETFQIPVDGFPTKTVRDVAPEHMVERQLKADQEVITTGASLAYEVKAPTPNGERYFRTNKFPIFDDKNNITGIGTMSTDITELKKQQAEKEVLATFFQEQNKQLINFSHILTHNLRTPVSNIKTLVKFYSETNDQAKKASHFERLQSMVGDLYVTFDELMEIFKIRLDLNKERELLSFEEVFNKTKRMVAGQLEEASDGARITHCFAQAATIHYPKVYLESIFLNLMSNGIKYRSPHRTLQLHFETRMENNKVILEVKDNGIGIDLSKYGNALFGLNKTFHNNTDAKGVGLYITKTQVEAMGGTIAAESAVDVGSTFKITFS